MMSEFYSLHEIYPVQIFSNTILITWLEKSVNFFLLFTLFGKTFNIFKYKHFFLFFLCNCTFRAHYQLKTTRKNAHRVLENRIWVQLHFFFVCL